MKKKKLSFKNKNYKIACGDCLDKLKKLPTNSVDSVVTDPPYGISFMSKKWDYDVPSVEIWKEVFRVLKPGGFLLSFAGTRTHHRMAINIEDAGFEIRDMIAWVHGQGFPKSIDISKAIDKKLGKKREVLKRTITKSGGMANVNKVNKEQKFRPNNYNEHGNIFEETIPASKQAKYYYGWGTALKPCIEPIVVARKPLSEKTVSDNVLKYGTGGLNIDGCRVSHNDKNTLSRYKNKLGKEVQEGKTGIGYKKKNFGKHSKENFEKAKQGRWPGNLIHDGSEEVVKLFPNTKSGSIKKGTKYNHSNCKTMGSASGSVKSDFIGSKGSASRFFYCAKASKKERDMGLNSPEKLCGMMEDDNYPIKTGSGKVRNTKRRNYHPTVKPVALMRYLVKLVTPKKGIVLDPFMGSGTTGISAIQEGFKFIGIEKEKDYFDMCKTRLTYISNDIKKENSLKIFS